MNNIILTASVVTFYANRVSLSDIRYFRVLFYLIGIISRNEYRFVVFKKSFSTSFSSNKTLEVCSSRVSEQTGVIYTWKFITIHKSPLFSMKCLILSRGLRIFDTMRVESCNSIRIPNRVYGFPNSSNFSNDLLQIFLSKSITKDVLKLLINLV